MVRGRLLTAVNVNSVEGRVPFLGHARELSLLVCVAVTAAVGLTRTVLWLLKPRKGEN